MEKPNELGNKKCWPLWATIAIILLLLLGLIFWVQYEGAQLTEKKNEESALKTALSKIDTMCECPKPKVKSVKKKAKKKTVIVKEVKSQSVVVVVVPFQIQQYYQKEKIVLEAEKDFYDNALMPRTWVTEKKEEFVSVPQPRVGRKIIVIRQQSTMPYYGGYSSGYSYAPQVTYGQQYIPPQTVYVPAPQVIVPPPSVVTPPSVGYRPQGYTGGVSPQGNTGGVSPQGNTGGRSPSGVTGPAR